MTEPQFADHKTDADRLPLSPHVEENPDANAVFVPTTEFDYTDIYDLSDGSNVTLIENGDTAVRFESYDIELSPAEHTVFVAVATGGRVNPSLLRTITPLDKPKIHHALRTLRALGWVRKPRVEAQPGNDLTAEAGEMADVPIYDFVFPEQRGEGILSADAPVRPWVDIDAGRNDPAPLPGDAESWDEMDRRFGTKTMNLCDTMRAARRVTPKYVRLTEGWNRAGVHDAFITLMRAGMVGVPTVIAAEGNHRDVEAGSRSAMRPLYDYVGHLPESVVEQFYITDPDAE